MVNLAHYKGTHSHWKTFKPHPLGVISFWTLILILILSCTINRIGSHNKVLPFPSRYFYSPTIFMPLNLLPKEVRGMSLVPSVEVGPPLISRIYPHRVHHPYHSISGLESPSARHWLGTTTVGHDVLTTVIQGTGILILFSFLLTLGTVLLGTGIGAFLAYYAGQMDKWIKWVFAVWFHMPHFFLILISLSMMISHLGGILWIVMAFGWVPIAHIVRMECLRTRNADYVRAGYALGVKKPFIFFQHVLPTAWNAIRAPLPFLLCAGTLTLTCFDFLELGVSDETPSIGRLLWQGKNTLHAPWIGFSAAVSLLLLLMLLFYVGKSVQKAGDPNQSGHIA